MQATLRQADTVARLGGDEFAIIQVAAGQPQAAHVLAKRLIEVLREPFIIAGQAVASSASVGIALGKCDSDADHLFRNADLALYLAKAAGRSTFKLFEPEMHVHMQKRQQLEADLRHAVSTAQLDLYFQPLFDLRRNEISGFEALIRWNHPDRGFVSPMEFIPLAEEVGLIDTIGEWVLRQAVLEAAQWPAHIKVAVNISPVQFRNSRLAEIVVRTLANSGLSPDRLELEITESVILHDDPETLTTLRQLRSLGVKISMDDFGTGYSSLSGLRSFPFDKIKLDRSFVRDSLQREDCAAIVRTVADLGKTLGMATTAEGVETIEQLENVRRHGFVEAQGYLFSPAVPAREARAMIERRDSLLQTPKLVEQRSQQLTAA